MDKREPMEDSDFLLNNYDYVLPKNAIAQYPVSRPDTCRLLVMDRSPANDPARDRPHITDAKFYEIGNFIQPGTLLVANNSKVLPARIMAKRPTGGKLEFLLLTPLPLVLRNTLVSAGEDGAFSSVKVECLLRPAAKIKVDDVLELAPEMMARVLSKGEFGQHEVLLQWRGNIEDIFRRHGMMPLPPYIERAPEKADEDNYQTFYASKNGSVAAPTAGLHFTDDLRAKLLASGIEWAEATLYVGYGTFSPVRNADIRKHHMHGEYVEMPEQTAEAICRAKMEGRPVVSIGTTSLRIMEGVFRALGKIGPWQGFTDIFIYPGQKIAVADGLITNFHLPLSTLLMLVSAMAGRKRILNVYQNALKRGYRFFSYGDCMFIR